MTMVIVCMGAALGAGSGTFRLCFSPIIAFRYLSLSHCRLFSLVPSSFCAVRSTWLAYLLA